MNRYIVHFIKPTVEMVQSDFDQDDWKTKILQLGEFPKSQDSIVSQFDDLIWVGRRLGLIDATDALNDFLEAIKRARGVRKYD